MKRMRRYKYPDMTKILSNFESILLRLTSSFRIPNHLLYYVLDLPLILNFKIPKGLLVWRNY